MYNSCAFKKYMFLFHPRLSHSKFWLSAKSHRTSFENMSKLVAKSMQGFNVVAVQGRQYRVASASMEYKGDRPLTPKAGKQYNLEL